MKIINNIKAIDVHIHFGKGSNSYKTQTHELIKSMDCLNIEWGIGSSLESLVGNYIEGNNFALKQVLQYKDRLKAYLVINPNYIDDMQNYIEKNFSSNGFVGLKLHTDMHGHSPMSEEVCKIYDYASKYNLPVLSHNFGSYDIAGKIATMFPNLIMIMAHGTSRIKLPNTKSEIQSVKALAQSIKNREHFYIDTATSVVPYGANELFAEIFGTERILFGSDMGFLDPAFSIARIYGGEFSEQQKQSILRENAKQLFGL
ncbi:MAG: amidohydrolase family protein [Clostridia bacterium]